MNKPKLPKANPYIAFCRLKNTELYQCCITDRNMTLTGVFAFKDDENNKRCFHDVKLLNIHFTIWGNSTDAERLARQKSGVTFVVPYVNAQRISPIPI